MQNQFTNAPNLLTLLRILLVPVVVYCLFQNTPSFDLAAALIFAFASITDFFDGYLARTMNLESVYGKLMDPLADKFLVVCSLIMLQQLNRVSAVIVMLVICRELGITGLRALASAEGLIIAASQGGKWKTALQMIALPLMMLLDGLWGLPTYYIGLGLLYFSLFLSLWSAKDYVVGFFAAIGEQARIKAADRKIQKISNKEIKKARRLARREIKKNNS